MRTYSEKRSVSSLAALLLLGVFGVGILLVLLNGANTYRRLTERDKLAYDSRTSLQYLTTKIRQAPAPAQVTLADFGDGDSLVISEQIGGTEYWTRIYCHDGWLMELFTVADGDFAPEDGERILRVQQLTLKRQGDLLWVELTDSSSREAAIVLHIRGGEGVSP